MLNGVRIEESEVFFPDLDIVKNGEYSLEEVAKQVSNITKKLNDKAEAAKQEIHPMWTKSGTTRGSL
ncbi:MAG: hypothetical protein IJ220_03110 [Clostridia bacterium]|nr:hypothetical protein [Clostridia bacterium]